MQLCNRKYSFVTGNRIRFRVVTFHPLDINYQSYLVYHLQMYTTTVITFVQKNAKSSLYFSHSTFALELVKPKVLFEHTTQKIKLKFALA